MGLTADQISRLYSDHAAAMLAFFARRGCEAEAAVDLVGETFAQAFVHRGQFRGSEDVEAIAWVYGIAKGQLADFFRKGVVRRRALVRLGVQTPHLVDADYERVEELAAASGHSALLAEELDQLSAPHRAALQLRVVEEREYAEVAGLLGVSEQVARARVSRALRVLRRRIVNREEESSNA